ncbi:MAG TPA: hypothetical protein VLF16_14045 [Pseudomonas sp.]|nr:hypothetical protein [Pseudomonas sp.]
MKRREVLGALVTLAATPLLASCSPDDRQASSMFSVDVWVDSSPDNLANSQGDPGLFSPPAPLTTKLPSGLRLEISCERIASGHFHVGGFPRWAVGDIPKVFGPLHDQSFPDDHASYVLAVKAGDETA